MRLVQPANSIYSNNSVLCMCVCACVCGVCILCVMYVVCKGIYCMKKSESFRMV